MHDAPTCFGPVSYSISRHGNVAQVEVDPPSLPTGAKLLLRLRLPAGESLTAVRAEATARVLFNRRSATIDLSGQRERVRLTAWIVSRGGPGVG